jgi:hypothetical protein
VSYSKGDICLGQGFVEYPEFNGMECELLEFDFDAFALSAGSLEPAYGPMWLVKWADGRHSWQYERQLRKKPPKSDYDGNQAGDWDLCPFNPYRQKDLA